MKHKIRERHIQYQSEADDIVNTKQIGEEKRITLFLINIATDLTMSCTEIVLIGESILKQGLFIYFLSTTRRNDRKSEACYCVQ